MKPIPSERTITNELRFKQFDKTMNKVNDSVVVEDYVAGLVIWNKVSEGANIIIVDEELREYYDVSK